ncbi:hypothetical protein NQ315_007224 [Exocentrus adspersus]|uniref:Protein-cysteine N-palmitoyltransferase Rasp n=1 Tax=Exocentrus adspersus TaxID=1586481 RepID=A0AAV8WCU2_9CUCU|nr:hypothetical protein NQ315_007224 [Exocentrus adspersus]
MDLSGSPGQTFEYVGVALGDLMGRGWGMCEYFRYYRDPFNDFTKGYYFSKKRDKSDFEWEALCYLTVHYFPWMFMYITISDFIRKLSLFKVFQVWQICFSLCYVLLDMGYVVVYILLLQPCIFYLLCNFYRNAVITWICSGISLLIITHCKHANLSGNFLKEVRLNEYELYFIVLCLFWMNLKCTSYFMEKQSSKNPLDFFAYCFYPPTVFTGPFIPYEEYLDINKSRTLSFLERVRKLFLNLSRCLFWFLFMNFILHYVYVNATAYQPRFVRKFNNWSLYGYGYAMGQFFHIKYVVLYGLGTSFASYENVTVPYLPRCIGRIHLYSHMWKYFDPGLYNFLVKYIYIPFCKIVYFKLIASLICFLFVYLWHGVEESILIWTALNYIGIVIEYVGNVIYKRFLETNHDEKGYPLRRVKCILASPLLALSAVSNFYFFAGTEIGNIFVQRILNDSIVNNISLLVILYCCCQVSTELQNIDANKM